MRMDFIFMMLDTFGINTPFKRFIFFAVLLLFFVVIVPIFT